MLEGGGEPSGRTYQLPLSCTRVRGLSPPSLGLSVQEGEDCRRNPGLGAPGL